MIDTTHDGGPAFPCEGGPNSGLHAFSGMSLRDWFAGQALAGILARGAHDLEEFEYTQYSLDAWGVADAMLAARNATPNPATT